jgi:hypothetical protein
MKLLLLPGTVLRFWIWIGIRIQHQAGLYGPQKKGKDEKIALLEGLDALSEGLEISPGA